MLIIILRKKSPEHPHMLRGFVNSVYFARLLRMGSHCSTVEESIRL